MLRTTVQRLGKQLVNRRRLQLQTGCSRGWSWKDVLGAQLTGTAFFWGAGVPKGSF